MMKKAQPSVQRPVGKTCSLGELSWQRVVGIKNYKNTTT